MTHTEKIIIFRVYNDLCRVLHRAPGAEDLGKEIGMSAWSVSRRVYPWLRRCDGLVYPVNTVGNPDGHYNGNLADTHITPRS